jgi:hypothetical protein
MFAVAVMSMRGLIHMACHPSAQGAVETVEVVNKTPLDDRQRLSDRRTTSCSG